jgi:anti-sigma B factor antagonist
LRAVAFVAMDGWTSCPASGLEGSRLKLSYAGGRMLEVMDQPDLVLAVQADRDRVIVRLVGELDIAVAGRVEATVKELVDVGFADIVVDLRGLSFMDSAGVHMLVSMKRWAEQATCRVSVIPGRGARTPQRVLELTGAESLLRFVSAETIDGAR